MVEAKGAGGIMRVLGSRTLVTSSEAADRVGSYDKAMRILREALERGLVERRVVKKGRGHPEHLFRPTLPDRLRRGGEGSPLEEFFEFLSELRAGSGAEVILGPFVSTTRHGMAVLQPEIRVRATPPERLLVEQFLEGGDGGLEPYRVIFRDRTRGDVERSEVFERDGICLRLLSASDTCLDLLEGAGVYDVLGAMYILRHERVDHRYLLGRAVSRGAAAKLGALLDVVREEEGTVPDEVLEVLRYFAEDEREESLPRGFEGSGEYSRLRDRWGIRFGLTSEEIRSHVERELEPDDWFDWLLSADRRLAEGGESLAG